ncbi:MAG: hypothetical protein ACRC2T_10520, partial [Thermoguttaceae bacterium]
MQRDQSTVIVMIIFILLTIVFGVLTYVGFNQSNKNYQNYDSAKKEAEKNAGDLRNTVKDLDTLKLIVGYLPDVNVDTIKVDHTAAFTKFGNNIPGKEEDKGYAKLLKMKESELQGKIKELADAHTMITSLTNEFAAITATTNERVNAAIAERDRAIKDLENEQSTYNNTLSNIRTQSQQLSDELARTRSDAEAAIAIARKGQAQANADLTKVATVNKQINDELSALKSPTFDVEDAKVISVNQREATVLLNIGSAAGLQPGTTFSVFEQGSSDVAVAKPKASIEVTRVLTGNTAQARIIGSILTNPIQIGDVVYTPVWKPGMHPQFAICGQVIIPGIGTRKEQDQGAAYADDLDSLRNLIHANGGKVDCYMSKDGTIYGEITANTTYLVKGTGENLDPDAMKSMLKLEKDAELNGIRV